MTPEEQAHALALSSTSSTPGAAPRRRLSWLRLGILVVVLAAAASAIMGLRAQTGSKAVARPVSSFAPYVDVTATPQYAFESPAKPVSTTAVLGFVVSSTTQACQPSWGASYSLSQASDALDLDRRIARLRQQGGQVMASFGGEANRELAVGCTDPSALDAAYRSVVDRYSLGAIDLDIEGSAASAVDVDTRRAQALATVQRAEQSAGRPLAIWLTLPVGPDGLNAEGQSVLDALLTAHVELAGVNALTMDYGQPLASGQTMAGLAEGSLTALARQVRTTFSAHGTDLTAAAVWQHLGATPMIGQNDTVSERFELADARALLAFAESHHLRRLSMWSANRDQSCGPNYADVELVSVNCSGVNQSAGGYAAVFDAFTSADAPAIGAAPTDSASSAAPTPAATASDDPATSPYPIWNPIQAYPAGTKIVWHHNVYQAKWYTQGDTPDAPVASTSETPWTLIGPVLPGEHPAPTPTLAAGLYPAWDATTIYTAGQRVLYNGVGYQAKWYNQGVVPGQVVADPGDTPWSQLGS